ncbi:MAG: hypothetical protein DRP13_02135 [Candidatus Aenigmatarchaeota archaeon]|nr:MAG: hypothetical protein DRP18_02175 [Candidatus Aenigmarchaeota archaeon]RLJ06972.1 MAG: hypothetical protein DRP16_04295 [Candidatus Aenigmarchaeota archaeon]RLJ08701.1 MAG: hypothetical protein DRP13_02135 [Candidatus Aenigmarchaeota archaeon]
METKLLKKFIEEQKQKENVIVNDIKDLWEEVNKLKASPAPKDLVKIEDNIFREFDRFRKSIEKEIERNQKSVQEVFLQIKTLSDEIKEIKSIRKKLQETDIDSIKRDMESVKLKLQWLENRIRESGHEDLFEKIEEIENMVKRLKASSPLVIE